jgi:hypothetical protein
MINSFGLQKGNWVAYRQAVATDPSVHKLLAIEEKTARLSNCPVGHSGWADREYEDIEPIPLTPEWLERFGFSPDDNDESTCPSWSGHGMTIEHNEEKENWSLSPLFGFWVSIPSVHHLQNLYLDLTGEQLTIKEILNP